MRIALLLRGIAYNKYYCHPTGKKLLIDYIKSINNYKENIYENNDVDIFFVTYYNDYFDIDKILEIYKPVCYEFITDPERNIGQTKNKYNSYSQTTIYVINLFLAYCSINNIDDYDHIIITRFDLLFKMKLSSLKLEKDKFTISCLAGNNLMDDNFFITNKYYLKEYLEVLSQRNKYQMMHQDYLTLCDKIGRDNIRFLIPGVYSIHNGNPLYNILRCHLDIDIFHNATLLIYNKVTNKYLNYNTSDNKIYISNYPGKFSIKTINNKYVIGIFDKQMDLVMDKTNLTLIKSIASSDTIISIKKKDNESYIENLRLQNSDNWIIFPTTFI